jgi:hypothetical protein
MTEAPAPDGRGNSGGGACCESTAVCVFAKALLSRSSACELAARRHLGERELIECSSPVARLNCGTLAALLHERARFALRLPAPGHPLMHAQALRLHCGGLQGLRRALDAERTDVHSMVVLAQERHGSLTALPWDEIVREIIGWLPRVRRRPSGDAR